MPRAELRCPMCNRRQLAARDDEIRGLKAKLKVAEAEVAKATTEHPKPPGGEDGESALDSEILAVRAAIKFLEGVPDNQKALVPDIAAKLAAKQDELWQLGERRAGLLPKRHAKLPNV